MVRIVSRTQVPHFRIGCAETRLAENMGDGGAASAPQYTPQPFSGFNMGQPVGYMQMEGTPGYPPVQVPYAPNLMSPPFQNSAYGMQQQQQYWTPQGPYQQMG